MIKLKHILNESKPGDCYQVSGRFIMDTGGDDKHRLVHGMVDGQGSLKGLRYGHAWVEYGNKVIDNSNGKYREYAKDMYYNVGNIVSKDTKYYNLTEARNWIAKTKHWGPWEMTGDIVHLREDIPTKKSEIGKRRVKVNPDDLNI